MELAGFIGVSQILKSGVYALVWRGTVVYIGKSRRMLARIYTHKTQVGKKSLPWLPVKGILFDEVFVRPCSLEVMDELEADMINLYKPRHNTKLKTKGKITTEVELKHKGFVIILNRSEPRDPGPKLEIRRRA